MKWTPNISVSTTLYYVNLHSTLINRFLPSIVGLFANEDSNKLFTFTNSNSVKMTSSCSNKQVIHFVPKFSF